MLSFIQQTYIPTLDQQASILIEAVQNHTPDVIICDEIGREEEVVATRTVNERGVRCIGSAHGSLRSLGIKMRKQPLIITRLIFHYN